METFEGLLRQLLQSPLPEVTTAPDICIVYTICKDDVDTWHAGELSQRAKIQEQLAEYYNLPSVSLAKGIADAVRTEQATWDDLMKDIVHPLDAGHEIYAKVLTASLEKMFAQTPGSPVDLPAPLSSDRYVRGAMRDLPHSASGWTWVDLENKGGWECFSGLLMSDVPDTELTLSFEGKLVGLYYQLGLDTGNLYYQIDDGPEKLLEPFDKHAPNCTRPQYHILDDQLADGSHTLRLRIAQSKDERSKGTWTRLAYLRVG